MSDLIPQNQTHRNGSEISSQIASSSGINFHDPRAFAREALRRAVHEIDTKNKKRTNSIRKLRFLIYELKSMQPADVNEISEALGQSHSTTLTQLKKLRKLDLVVRTSFEHHTLYCLNGNFNKFIEDILSGFYFGEQAS
jgi:hypothetical protein